ncbi:hypothetical protein [Rhizobium rhizogenes]|uniref:Uncharacterized protein n=1 Tax=Rhizobium rhizogenes TaxID=359 RepID=A0AA92C3B3_RHIRH|nr:hypothetical protein [Rhizobium rhizogenes]PVE54019.1 hypothetical protein DC430_12275 [Rhizobium rhizogenes]PVE66510.1 hypothetical protein DC415_08890 [Agrobacterium tumefaciens]PVE76498.1 hypothetical protein DCP16_08890 [Sphingomonas sp. TPD3009]
MASKLPSMTNERRSNSAKKKSDNPKNTASKPTLTLTQQIINLHDSFQKQKKAHRKSVRSDIVKAVDIGLELRKNKNEWENFCENAWKEGAPKVNQIDHAVRYAIKYMVGPGKSAQKKASFYYNAVAMAVENGLKGKELKKLMKDKSLKKLAQEYALHKKNASADKVESAFAPAKLPTKKVESKKAIHTDKVKSRPKEEPVLSDGREEKLKGDGHEWRTILRFEKASDRLTNIKVGQTVRIQAIVRSAGPTLILAVKKAKVKTV